MVSVQIGAALVKGLFPVVGVSGDDGAAAGISSIMLLAVWRPWRLRPTAREARSLVIYGIAMGCMNFFFYSALSRIPLGIAVALEFTGPLAVAIAASHRAVDYLWVCAGGARPRRAAASGLDARHRSSPVGHRVCARGRGCAGLSISSSGRKRAPRTAAATAASARWWGGRHRPHRRGAGRRVAASRRRFCRRPAASRCCRARCRILWRCSR